MKNKSYKLGKPRRSFVEIIKVINSKKMVVDIMTIKGTGGIVRKPEWFKNFEKKNNERWQKQDDFNNVVLNFIKQQQEFNKQQQEFNQMIIKLFKDHKRVK